MMPYLNHNVNKNLPAKLFISPNNVPCIETPNKSIVQVPNTAFGGWWVATRYPNLIVLKNAHSWWQTFSPYSFTIPKNLTKKPRIYQILCCVRMSLGNCGIWFDMGLGKTFCSIMFALKLFENKKSKFFLILCPPSVFVTWMDEIKKIISPNIKPRISLLHGPARKRKIIQASIGNKNSPHFLITSYETLNSIYEKISKFPLGAIFSDESTRIKNRITKRTEAVFKLRNLVPTARRFCLSGTPSTTKVLGYYSQLEWLIEGSTQAGSYKSFEDRYMDSGLFMKVQLPSGTYKHIYMNTPEKKDEWLQKNYPPGKEKNYKELGYFFTKNTLPNNPKSIKILHFYKRQFKTKNLFHLKSILQTYSYTVKKKHVAKELPEKTYLIREISMSKKQKELYKEVSEKYKATFEKFTFNFSDKTSPFVKLHQIANGFIKSSSGELKFLKDQPKLKELEHFISELGEEKLVIWSPLVPQIHQISTFLTSKFKNSQTVEIYGETPVEKRPSLIHLFQEDPKTKFLIANPEIGGIGLNLQCSNIQIFMTNWYKPDTRLQAEDRQHRIGQKNPVTIYDFLTKGTLEKQLLANLRKKIQLENSLINTSDLTEGEKKWG